MAFMVFWWLEDTPYKSSVLAGTVHFNTSIQCTFEEETTPDALSDKTAPLYIAQEEDDVPMFVQACAANKWQLAGLVADDLTRHLGETYDMTDCSNEFHQWDGYWSFHQNRDGCRHQIDHVHSPSGIHWRDGIKVTRVGGTSTMTDMTRTRWDRFIPDTEKGGELHYTEWRCRNKNMAPYHHMHNIAHVVWHGHGDLARPGQQGAGFCAFQSWCPWETSCDVTRRTGKIIFKRTKLQKLTGHYCYAWLRAGNSLRTDVAASERTYADIKASSNTRAKDCPS